MNSFNCGMFYIGPRIIFLFRGFHIRHNYIVTEGKTINLSSNESSLSVSPDTSMYMINNKVLFYVYNSDIILCTF